MKPAYIYNAHLILVVDGDTIVALIDLGCHTFVKKRIRLTGINAPELKTDEGKAAKQWLATRLGDNPLVVQTRKDKADKYARLLGAIYIGDVNVNEEMIIAKQAIKYG